VAALALILASGWGCDEDSDPVASGPVIGEIPWEAPEETNYRLLDGDDELGTARITVDAASGDSAEAALASFKQAFEFPEREITDEVEALAVAETLAPDSISRVVDGPEGERKWDVEYEDGVVTVHQSDENDERTDNLGVPQSAYDTWTDLFLWRTLDFREGYDVSYLGVVTADFSKPEVITIELRVKGLETVEVPAGTYEAWRLEIRAGGRTQKAWIANDDTRTLVRYDNTELVFELQ
jgi:hypothetical protein